jgi:hypothetical protein
MAPGSIPQEMVVLPNVETFSLSVHGEEDMQVYEPAVQISCPRAKYTSLTQIKFDNGVTHDLEAFPGSVSLEAIVRQYSTSPVEQVMLEIRNDKFMTVTTYSLTFQSSDTTVIRLGFELGKSCGDEEEFSFSHEATNFEIFSQACRTIRDHPLLSHVKRLHIVDRTGSFGADRPQDIAEVVRELFSSLGPLDELVIHGCNLQIFLPEFGCFERALPPVKELTILELRVPDGQWYMNAIVELAELQHGLGKPFKRVTVCGSGIPGGLADKLRQWVSAADCDGL